MRPGHWSDFLSEGGRRDVVGIDASAQFLRSARQRFTQIGFVQGDLVALPVASDSVGGVLSWFSVIHSAPEEVSAIVREFARILTRGGSLLLGFFDGEAGKPFDHAVTTGYYWSTAALGGLLEQHGFMVQRQATRTPPGRRRQGELVATLDV